jgi:hypothetical protein
MVPFLSPTPSPTSFPTPVGTVISETIEEARIKLENVGQLDRNSQISFEGALDGWYDNLYNSENGLRRLKVKDIVDLTTNTFYKNQIIANTTNTITYKQVVSYTKFNLTVDTAFIVKQPFGRDEFNRQLRERFRASDPAFVNLP